MKLNLVKYKHRTITFKTKRKLEEVVWTSLEVRILNINDVLLAIAFLMVFCFCFCGNEDKNLGFG